MLCAITDCRLRALQRVANSQHRSAVNSSRLRPSHALTSTTRSTTSCARSASTIATCPATLVLGTATADLVAGRRKRWASMITRRRRAAAANARSCKRGHRNDNHEGSMSTQTSRPETSRLMVPPRPRLPPGLTPSQSSSSLSEFPPNNHHASSASLIPSKTFRMA